MFPDMTRGRSMMSLFWKIFNFFCVAVVVIGVAVNLMIPSRIFWAGFLAAAVLCMWILTAVAIFKRKNLLKNALEHTKAGGSVLCSSEQNLLYTLIRIENEGDGFAPEDLPHLFERFYRGQNAAPGGAGIGLSLAKELIEMQNGTLSACNLPSGNACFEIRFYCH